MTLIAPLYYTDFRCIADRCRHNCCVGWEIDIDEDTAAFYRSIGGPLGQRLSEHIQTIDGQASFCLREDERCPFLNGQNLCDIILSIGETALCQICRDHPRFRNHFSDRVEIGLGLCCEAAAERILTNPDKTVFVTVSDDGVSPTEEETRFFAWRESIFAVAQDRTASIAEREDRLLSMVAKQRSPLTAAQFYRLLSPLERLEDDWTALLLQLQHATPSAALLADECAFEQLLVYFLYRHLAGALEDDRFSERVAFAVQSTRLIRMLCTVSGGTIDALLEAARLYSAEIEYSNDNLQTMIDAF